MHKPNQTNWCRNKEVLIIFAAGNEGGDGTGTIASPASAKNCLAVWIFPSSLLHGSQLHLGIL